MSRLPHRWCTFVVCLFYSLINSAQLAHAGVTEWMDLRVVNGFLMVETEIAGIAGLSMVDTGSQVTGINSRFLESEGLSFKKDRMVTIEGVYGKDKRSTYREVTATIFGAPVTITRLVDLELGEPNIQLLLGAGFLNSYIFQFDYTNERMRLVTRDSVDLKAIKNVDAKTDRDSGSLLVRVGLDEDTKAWLLMDTGSNGGILLDRALARRLDWLDTYPRVDGVASGAISSGEMEYFRVPSIQIGPYEIENVLVSVPAPGESPEFFETSAETGSRLASRKSAAGLLGFDILQHFVVTIDFDRGYVHFYPGEKVPTDAQESQ